MIRLLEFIGHLVYLYEMIVIASVVASWLIALNVINLHNPMVRSIWTALMAVTEPLLNPIRRFIRRILPNLGPIDLSPIVLLLGCFAVRYVVIGNLIDLFR